MRKDLYNRHVSRHEKQEQEQGGHDSRTLGLEQNVYADTETNGETPTLPGFSSVTGETDSLSMSTNGMQSAQMSTLTHSHIVPQTWQSQSSEIDIPSNNDRELHTNGSFLPSDQPAASGQSSDCISEGVISDSIGLTDWLFSSGLLSSKWGMLNSDANSFLVSSIRNFSDISTPPSFTPSLTISEEKRTDLLTCISELASFPEFSLNNLKIYNEMYWERFHFQFPIIHRPSFDVEETPSPLLLCIILVGAYYSGASEEFRSAIAVPLRWVIFSSPRFHPPTRVWILQSLLLLEIYEKALATSRQLHERAHIHHGATLQLIRRGATLLDSASLPVDNTDSSTWKRWVESESIKRAVFVAFILDIMHAVLFCHGQLMQPHEIRLSLPCDDLVWDSLDDRRKLLDNPTVPFLTGLRRILSGEKVEVASELGRLALLYGLVSLANHMRQLDDEVSLGLTVSRSFQGKWQPTLGDAFDFWWADYDGATSDGAFHGSPSGSSEVSVVRSNNREDYILHYHFAHISMHVRGYELHIFCGDRLILGLTTLRQDYLAAEKYMYEWSKTEGARIAAFHAIKAMEHVLLQSTNSTYPTMYSVSKDVFVHRPMILAHCALTFWAYAFCLDGPESSILGDKDSMVTANSDIWKEHEWAVAAESGRKFLERASSIRTPDDLLHFPNRNYTVGLLKWLILSLGDSQWVVMTKMCRMMDNCVKRSRGWDRVVEDELSYRDIQVG